MSQISCTHTNESVCPIMVQFRCYETEMNFREHYFKLFGKVRFGKWGTIAVASYVISFVTFATFLVQIFDFVHDENPDGSFERVLAMLPLSITCLLYHYVSLTAHSKDRGLPSLSRFHFLAVLLSLAVSFTEILLAFINETFPEAGGCQVRRFRCPTTYISAKMASISALTDGITVFMITPLMPFPAVAALVLFVGMVSRVFGLFIYNSDRWPTVWALTCVSIPKMIFLACRYRREWAKRKDYILQLQIKRLNTELQHMLDGLIPPDFSRRAQHEEVVADPHDRATVLFCSFPLDYSADADPAAAFRLLDEVYRAFDAILEAHAHSGLVTKVEHVGHDYLAVSPVFLPAVRQPPPDAACGGGSSSGGGGEEDWAADSCAALAGVAREVLAAGRTRLAGSGMELRVGLATGPVVAAVIGRSRRYLRVLGDTVNTAARLCSLAGPWQVRRRGDPLPRAGVCGGGGGGEEWRGRE